MDSKTLRIARFAAAMTLTAVIAGGTTPVLGQSGGGARPQIAPQRGSGSSGSGNTGSAAKGSGSAGSGTAGSGSSGSGNSGSGSAASGSGSAAKGSGLASRPTGPVALRGFCPVAIVDAGQWVKGLPEFASVVDGKVYHFVNKAAKARFDADPITYTPGLGGDDIVSFANTGQRQKGSLAYGARHGKRIYFFASERNKQQFMASPAAAASFAAADLAMGGDCVVCRVDLQQSAPGRPDTAVVHQGIRYQFIGREQQQRFLSSPGRYVTAANAAAAPAGSSTQGSGSQGSGSQGSAAAGSGAQGSGSTGSGSNNRGSGAAPAGSGSQPKGSGTSAGSGSQGR